MWPLWPSRHLPPSLLKGRRWLPAQESGACPQRPSCSFHKGHLPTSSRQLDAGSGHFQPRRCRLLPPRGGGRPLEQVRESPGGLLFTTDSHCPAGFRAASTNSQPPSGTVCISSYRPGTRHREGGPPRVTQPARRGCDFWCSSGLARGGVRQACRGRGRLFPEARDGQEGGLSPRRRDDKGQGCG